MRTFLEEVAENLHQKFGADFKDIAIVFNHRRPAAYLQKQLAKCIGKPFWAPEFFTLQSFFAQITGKKKASSLLQLTVLHQQMQDILGHEGITNRWGKMEDFFTIGKTLLSDFEQIQRECVDPLKLYKNLQEFSEIDAQFGHLSEEKITFLKRFWGTFSSEKQMAKQEEFIKMWRRMPVLYHQFYDKLNQLSLYTEGQLYRMLASKIEDYDLKSFRKVIFVGFNALSKAEIQIYQHWQEREKALFYFDIDTHYLNDSLQEAGLFLRNNLQKHQLINQLNTQSQLHSEKNMQIYAAKGHTVQASYLDDILSPFLTQFSTDKNVLNQTAIILLDEKLLFPTLQYIPRLTADKSEIPVNISMGLSVQQNAIYSFLDHWITLQKYYISSEQKTAYQAPQLLVQAFLWNKYSGVQETKRNEILDEIIKKQYAYVPLDLLQSDFFNNTSAYFSIAKTPNEVLSQLKNLLNVSLNVIQTEKEIYTFEWQTLQKLTESLGQLSEEIEQLKNLQLIQSQYLTPELVLELWRQEMSNLHINPDSINHDALQIMGLLESRSLNFENLIFIGANEGILPKTSLAQTFIPDNIRRAYQLPVSENLDAVSAYMFYRLIQRAKNIHLIYNDLSDENNSGEISRFVTQIEYELPFKIQHHQRNYKISVPQHSKIEIVKNEAIQKKLQAFFQQWASLSPSAFTLYLNCELQYYFQYIAEIRQPEVLEADIPAYKIGNILHRIMESLYEPYLNQELNEAHMHQIQAEVEKSVASHFNKELFDNEYYKGKLSGIHEIIKMVLNQYVQNILAHDTQLLPFKVLKTELSIAHEIEIMANGKKQRIKLRGFIDRVDALIAPNGEEHMRIVDYKTGRDELKFNPIEKETENNIRNHHFPEKLNKAWVQTMLYAYMYEQQYGLQNVEPNLYILRKMKTEGTVFVENRRKTDENLTSDEDFLAAFASKVEEMFNFNIPYKQTPRIENCSYCAYKNICGR